MRDHGTRGGAGRWVGWLLGAASLALAANCSLGDFSELDGEYGKPIGAAGSVGSAGETAAGGTGGAKPSGGTGGDNSAGSPNSAGSGADTGGTGGGSGACKATEWGPDCKPCECVRGKCDAGKTGDGSCECLPGWAGKTCDSCDEGFFGASCQACACVRGECADGKDGDGACSCPAEYGGSKCQECAEGRYGADCKPCDCVHGTCADGISGDGACACEPGWAGDKCDKLIGTCNWGREAGISTAAGDSAPTHLAKHAFDGQLSTKWLHAGTTTSWVQFEFKHARQYAVQGYALTSGDDNPGRDPKHWVFEGSNDGATFTKLDERTDEAFAERRQRRAFALAAPSLPYRFYRLRIESIANAELNAVQLMDMELLASCLCRVPPPAFLGDVSSRAQVSPTQVGYMGVDGLNTTQWRDPSQAASWLQLKTPLELAAAQYTVGSGTNQALDPMDWTLEGSADGVSGWKVLDTRSGELFTERNQLRTFAVAAPENFRFYRLNITKARETDTSVAVAEFALEAECESIGARVLEDFNNISDWTNTNMRATFSQLGEGTARLTYTNSPDAGYAFNRRPTTYNVTQFPRVYVKIDSFADEASFQFKVKRGSDQEALLITDAEPGFHVIDLPTDWSGEATFDINFFVFGPYESSFVVDYFQIGSLGAEGGPKP
jgi:hypothetical protein